MKPVHPAPHKVCVIGAGVSGLCAMKELDRAGVPFDTFDERAGPGGIWQYQEAPGRTCAWASLHMNSPRGTYDFSDYPMPKHYPDFPSRQQVLDYLDAAIDHYGLRAAIRFHRRVLRVEPEAEGWRVTLDGGSSTLYRAVVVANGHHNEPNLPAVAGSFTGRMMHSGEYRHREPFAGLRVLVVGYGNSGSQIAVDLSHSARQVLLAMRSGTWIFPHYIRGVRIDRWLDPRMAGLLPHRLDDLIFSGLYRLLAGRPDRHGLPKPRRGLASIFPTIAENLVNRIGDGRIRVVREPTAYEGNSVTFADGARAEVDAVIHATGYRMTFPFLDPQLLQVADNRMRLYMRTFHPRFPTLSVIGGYQAQAQWGFLPLMECQAKLVAAHLAGRYALPPAEVIEASMDADERDTARRFVDTPRHHYQLMGPVYLRKWAQELKRGETRARAGLAHRPDANNAPLRTA
ncbi:NAD(P)-binding domain-containing protein [Ramlibacter solisilvae]|uniref:flavin-containing monooxygenase n=1 Tax=Ramlibacter tataouinensis TaxID=94132 RepID=UPI000B1131B8|nr:NAD(P)-binding domain-containing protein [Ramlibacter tataouinensis]